MSVAYFVLKILLIMANIRKLESSTAYITFSESAYLKNSTKRAKE